MTPSANFFNLVRHFEGMRIEAYKDIAGVWTIGFGITHYDNGDAVKEGDTITEYQATQFLYDHIQGVVIPAMQQHEYDACLDFIYNVGQGAFNGSTLRKHILSKASSEQIGLDFLAWDKAHVDGALKEVDGLKRRRMCEAYLFIHGENHPTFYL